MFLATTDEQRFSQGEDGVGPVKVNSEPRQDFVGYQISTIPPCLRQRMFPYPPDHSINSIEVYAVRPIWSSS